MINDKTRRLLERQAQAFLPRLTTRADGLLQDARWQELGDMMQPKPIGPTYTRQQVGSAYRLWEQLSVATLRSPAGSAYNRRCERLQQRAFVRAMYIKLHQRAPKRKRL